MVEIIHTLMGNFCHGDKNKESQPKDMGNDACIMIAYHAKVSYCCLQQHVPVVPMEITFMDNGGKYNLYNEFTDVNSRI
jgi:hypothetical protein